MGTAQSSKRAATSDEVHIGTVTHQGHSSHGATRVEDDFETHRRGAATVGASSPSNDENFHGIPNEVPDSVNQMLQAALGDEPGLNLSTMRHDSNASELRRPGEKGSECNKLPTVFRWEHGGDEVYLAGTFSNWKRIPMVRSRDNFFTIYELAEGEHEYKFVVDGAWRCDDKVETKSAAEQGAVNNVIRVKNSDFEVFEALQSDVQSSAANNNAATQKEVSRKTGESETPAASAARLQSNLNTAAYTQEMPSRRSLEFEPPPPALPPHLLQVLLNKDTAANYDPNLLPEPNHVMLNHLYALSIREGVMVLSATHRYRKKYVTTLLYKPIQ